MGGARPADGAVVPAGGVITLPPQFVFGPFSVRSDGVLTLRDPGQAPGFQFWWRRCHVMVVLADDRLTLRAAIGRVPSTVEAAQVRPLVFSTLRGLPATLPQNWQIRLMPDHKVTLDAQEKLAAPSTAALLITELTRFLLALEPYLDLLLEAGVVLPMEAPGSAPDPGAVAGMVNA